MTSAGSVIRVLVCEDSKTYAAALTRFLEKDGDIEVAAVCRTAEAAITLLPELKPDLVTMDIELPGMSGMKAVEQIMNAHPVPIMVLSSHVQRHSGETTAALAAGALDAVPKDEVDLLETSGRDADSFRHRVKVLSAVRVIRHPRARLRRGRQKTMALRTASAIGVCASTGGPQALAAVLSALPRSFPIPVLVVQHMSPGFTEGLARWLDDNVAVPVRLAEAGTPLAPGVSIAPDGAHLLLERSGKLALDRSILSGYHRPSGDILLESLAASVGDGAVGVILTGMGRDGAEGTAAVAAGGGLTVAQDEASSVVFGMPRAAVESGAELILSPVDIGDLLSGLLPRRQAA